MIEIGDAFIYQWVDWIGAQFIIGTVRVGEMCMMVGTLN